MTTDQENARLRAALCNIYVLCDDPTLTSGEEGYLRIMALIDGALGNVRSDAVREG